MPSKCLNFPFTTESFFHNRSFRDVLPTLQSSQTFASTVCALIVLLFLWNSCSPPYRVLYCVCEAVHEGWNDFSSDSQFFLDTRINFVSNPNQVLFKLNLFKTVCAPHKACNCVETWFINECSKFSWFVWTSKFPRKQNNFVFDVTPKSEKFASFGYH